MFTKINAAKILFVLIVGSSVALPLVASAYTTPSLWPTGYWGAGGLVSCTGNYLTGAGATAGTTPCTSLCDLINTFINIVYFLMSIAIFIITPIMFIWGGIMIMLAGANPGMLETGKKIFTGTVIGLAIVLCSYLLVSTVIKVLGVTTIGGFGGAACTPNNT
jgi:hypothetical protein